MNKNTDSTIYGYYGNNPIEEAVYKYIVEELTKEFKPPEYAPTKIHIPFVRIATIDKIDKDTSLVYLDSWLENYNIVGDTLECISTGSYSGIMHVKNNKVVKFERLIDFDDWEKSTREILGDHYDEFMKVYKNSDGLDDFRKSTILKYVKSNGLKVTKFQDENWDPVELY